MLECIMLSTASDFEYWKTVIEEGLKEGEVEEEFEIKGFNGEGEIGRVDILSEEVRNRSERIRWGYECVDSVRYSTAIVAPV